MASTAAAAAAEASSVPSSSYSSTSTPRGFPVPAASFDAAVLGVATRFVVAAFGDCFLVAATPTGAMGTVMRVSRCDGRGIGGGEMEELRLGDEDEDVDAAGGGDVDGGDDQSQPRPPPLSSFDVATLSGRRDSPILEASARSLAASLAAKGVQTPLTLVCLALKDDGDAAAARGVTTKLKEAIEARR